MSQLSLNNMSQLSLKFKITRYNAARIILAETYRCTNCQQNHVFPFSYLF